jgi:hypothetical protein
MSCTLTRTNLAVNGGDSEGNTFVLSKSLPKIEIPPPDSLNWPAKYTAIVPETLVALIKEQDRERCLYEVFAGGGSGSLAGSGR